jgi:hypothetical protein
MALDASQLADMIDQQLVAQGANGDNKKKFCKAIATGIVKSVKGKTFVTLDVGTIPGIGQGTGIGIMGLMPDQMAKVAMAAGPTMLGANALKLMTAIMNATQQHFAMSASLSSTDTPVFLGSGVMVLGSIQVTPDEMSSNIKQALDDAGAKGKNREPLAKAVAAGVSFGLLTMGTGSLVIVGAPTGIPVGGGGPGQGTVS